VANVARVIVRFGLADHTLTSNLLLHVKAADGHDELTDEDRQKIGAATVEWWELDGASYGAVASAYPSQITLDEVVVTNVEPALSDDTITVTGSYAGTFTNIFSGALITQRYMLPPQCSFLIGLRTTLDTRRGRGRVYMPAHMTFSAVGVFPLAEIEKPDRDAMAIGYVNGIGTTQEDVAHIASRIAEAYYNTPDRDPGEFVQCVYSKLDHVGRAVTHFAIAEHVRTQRPRALHPSPHAEYGLDGVGL